MSIDDRLVPPSRDVLKAFTSKTPFKIVGDLIGGGGSRVVYRAEDTERGGLRAVKIYQDEGYGRQGYVQRKNHSKESINNQEGGVLSKLKQDNIVRWFDSGVLDVNGTGWVYSVEEFIEGKDLMDVIRDGDEYDRKYVIDSVVAALSHMHRNGYAHRDVKAENVMLGYDGQVVLADLQFAVHEDDFEEWGSDHGNGDYMPPDMGEGVKADYSFDVFSLGVLVHQMVTGSREKFKDVVEMDEKKYGRYLYFDVLSAIEDSADEEFMIMRDSLKYYGKDRFANCSQMENAIRQSEEGVIRQKKMKWQMPLVAGLFLLGIGVYMPWIDHLIDNYAKDAAVKKEAAIVAFDEQAAMKPLVERLGLPLELAPSLKENSPDIDLRPERIVVSEDGKVRTLVKHITINGQKYIHLTNDSQSEWNRFSWQIPDPSPDDNEVITNSGFIISSHLPTGLRYSCSIMTLEDSIQGFKIQEKNIKNKKGKDPLLEQSGDQYPVVVRNWKISNIGSSKKLNIDSLNILSVNPEISQFRAKHKQSIYFNVNYALINEHGPNKDGGYGYMSWHNFSNHGKWVVDGLEKDLGGNPWLRFEGPSEHIVTFKYDRNEVNYTRSWNVVVPEAEDTRPDLAVSNVELFSSKGDMYIVKYSVKNIGHAEATDIEWDAYVDEKKRFGTNLEKNLDLQSVPKSLLENQMWIGFHIVSDHSEGKMVKPKIGRHSYKIRIDPNNKIDEANEDNNYGYLEFEVK